jgi:glycerol-3-phosphate dehydrogenase (NAD(P)+)
MIACRGRVVAMAIETIGVIGGGAWGTALAATARLAGRDVLMWARDGDVVAEINQRHTNGAYLPGVVLDSDLAATADLARMGKADAVLLVTPAQTQRATARALAPHIAPGTPVVICSKGLEQGTGKLMTEVLTEEIPSCRMAVLSGPGFADDVVRGLPTALTLACADEALGKALAEAIGYRHFRLYWSGDTTGVAFGGALKNVLAIAAGIVDGRGLGASAHAALVTRGFAELRRLGHAIGADPETLVGLSGLGDLLLTCGSPQSRNMRLGRLLGQGRGLSDALSELHSTAEGVYTAASAVRQAADHGVDVPISAAVHAIIEGELTVDAAIASLLSRPFRSEV